MDRWDDRGKRRTAQRQRGIIGGDVTVNDGAVLAPGGMPGAAGTLTVNGNLALSSGSILFYNMVDTTGGGALNDVTNVHGNLTLDGTINVLDQGQTLGPGVYRVFNYDGTLTNNGLTIGSFTSDPTTATRPLTDFSVQTVVPGQVNLINTQGLSLTYWDGDAGPKNDNIIEGGNGTWRTAGPASTSNWTDPNGAVNVPWATGQFAIFTGAAGTVTVSSDQGPVQTSGMQFATSVYVVQGAPLNLVD